MSLSVDRQQLHCDGADCAARVAAPVGLRQWLAPRGGTAASPRDWLFVSSSVGDASAALHFCPRCAGHYLLGGALPAAVAAAPRAGGGEPA
jgi:hypothetical protein